MLLWEGYRRHIRRHTGPEFKAVPCLHPDRQTDRKTLFCLLHPKVLSRLFSTVELYLRLSSLQRQTKR